MKILIITGIIAFITISIWLAKKSEIKPASQKTFDQQDNPINFGYKTVWIAVKTNDKLGISKILELKNVKPSNWKSGIENAYHKSVFITPQIGDWTLAVGMGLPL